MFMTEHDFEEVENILDSDLEDFGDDEVQFLYDQMERFAEVADVMDTMDRGDDAEYFRELAVDSYSSFYNVMQLKKGAEDYEF